MKRLSWPGLAVVAGSTILSWLLGTPGVPSATRASRAAADSAARPAAAPAPTESAAAAVTAMQLHDWSAGPSTPAPRERDIFAFRRRSVEPPVLPAAAAAAPDAGLQPPQSAPVLLRLIGVAEDSESGELRRTAVLSGQGQLYLAKEGDVVAVYTVGRISADSVELVEAAGGATLRLTLK